MIDLPIAALRHQRIGGVESAVYNLVHGLVEAGADVAVGVPDLDRLSPEFVAWLKAGEEQEKVRIDRMTALPGPKSMRFAEETAYAMRRGRGAARLYPNYFVPPISRGSGPDSVLIHDSQFRILPENFTASKRRWQQWCYETALARADIVFTISDYERHLLGEQFGGHHADKCVTIYNAIDFARFDRGSPRAAIVKAATRRYALTVAHQFPHKNVATLIAAFGHVAARERDLHLLLVGTKVGNAAEAARAALDAGARERVHLLGFVSDADLGHLYRNAALFVLPSLYEGFGMPAAEAVGMGVPSLVSDATAIPEVTMGLAPLVPAASDARGWAEAIEAALASPPDASMLARSAERMRERYAPAAVGGRVIEALGAL